MAKDEISKIVKRLSEKGVYEEALDLLDVSQLLLDAAWKIDMNDLIVNLLTSTK